MNNKITLEDLKGFYDISYQSTPLLEGWYEGGFGSAKIEGDKLIGVDAFGVIWDASFIVNPDNTLSFNAILDPSKAPPNAGLINKEGKVTRDIQSYSGKLKVTKTLSTLILRTRVQQGPLTIDVQFRKK